MQVELDATSKQWLNPILKAYGNPIPNKSAVGGWELGTVSKGGAIQGLSGTLNASQDAYRSIMKQSIVPKVKPPVVVVKPKGATIPIVKGPRVMFGAVHGVDRALDGLTTMIVMNQLRDIRARQLRERVEEDIEVASAAAQAAAQASARAATKVKQRTMTKRKLKGRVRIHGYSRRSGLAVKDFKRKSPR
jgi:hypothetical protein